MSKIIYVCHYDVEKGTRITSPAGLTLMNYVINSINSLGYDLTVFSPAQQNNTSAKNRETVKINEKTDAIFMRSIKRFTKFKLPPRFIYLKQIDNQIYKELKELVEEGDTVIVYHSLSLINAVTRLRKEKNFKLILQVAEIYSDVLEDTKNRQKEIDFIKTADKYILISSLLAKKLELDENNCIVCSGAYKTEKVINTPKEDKIHVLYAGTLDPTKGGAYYAMDSAKYLNEKYHLHILGFGTSGQIAHVKEILEKQKNEFKCTVTYDGCLQGTEYVEFLQGCHIGLSTQNPGGSYNDTSFPSKILVYLANGLKVVSVKIPAIESSPVGQAMHFYENSTPEEIAKAILSVDLEKTDGSRELIKRLNEEFVENIKKLLEN